MDNHQIFDLWLKQFPLGWLPIALSQQRQIFMVIDLRYYEGRYLYVMANSREDVMKWILSPENEILRNISYKNNKKITWFYSEKFKRGKIRESFEIVRLLENELPKSPFPVLDAMDRGSFDKLNKVPKIDKNSKSNTKKNIFRLSKSTNISPIITEFSNVWYWDFNEAVFQAGVLLTEFDRMYLIRCLFRKNNLVKTFLGWKVQLIREIGASENLEHPFWNVSIKEEQYLGNLLHQWGFFPENNSIEINTPKVERKRRAEFQKKL